MYSIGLFFEKNKINVIKFVVFFYIYIYVIVIFNILFVQEGKIVLYWVVEKGYVEICKLLLNNDLDLEIVNKVCYIIIL